MSEAKIAEEEEQYLDLDSMPPPPCPKTYLTPDASDCDGCMAGERRFVWEYSSSLLTPTERADSLAVESIKGEEEGWRVLPTILARIVEREVASYHRSYALLKGLESDKIHQARCDKLEKLLQGPPRVVCIQRSTGRELTVQQMAQGLVKDPEAYAQRQKNFEHGLKARSHRGRASRREVHFSIRNPGEAFSSGMPHSCQIAVYIH